MTPLRYSLIAVAIISLISLTGVATLLLDKKRIKQISIFLVSLATGALFGDVFIHILPEAFKQNVDTTGVSISVLGGILIFFILEKILH